MPSVFFVLFNLALMPWAYSLPAVRPYYTSNVLTWKMDPYISPPYYHKLQMPFYPMYQQAYQPFLQELNDNNYPMPGNAELQRSAEYDARNKETATPNKVVPSKVIVVPETHRRKRSPFFFGRYPSHSSAYSSSGASNFSGFGTSLSKTYGNSGAYSTGGGAAYGSSSSNAFGGSFGGFPGFGGPSFSSSSSNTNAAAFSRPSYNPWSFFRFHGR